MPVKWTNRSRPPSSGVMKPKPLSSLNHLTVPVAMYSPSCNLYEHSGLPAHAGKRSRAGGGPLAKPTAHGALHRSHSSCSTTHSAQLLGDRSDLVTVAGGRRPRQAQGVAFVARDHVNVKV